MVDWARAIRANHPENGSAYVTPEIVAITVFDDYDDIVDKTCDAWNLRIASITNSTEDLSSPQSKQSSKHPLKPPLAVPNQTSSFAGGYWL